MILRVILGRVAGADAGDGEVGSDSGEEGGVAGDMENASGEDGGVDDDAGEEADALEVELLVVVE